MIEAKVRLAGVACGMVVIGIGAYFFIHGSADISHWPSVEGIIQSSEVSRRSVARSTTGGESQLKIQYAYEVGDKMYVSKKANLISDCVPPALWKKDRRRWQVGSCVQVFYEPKNPARAVLFPQRLTLGQKTGPMFVIAVGTFVALVFAFGKEQGGGSEGESGA